MKTRVYVAVALTAAVALGLGACSKKTAKRAVAFPDSLVASEAVAVVNGDTIHAKDLKVLAYTTTPASLDSMKSRSFNLMLLDQMVDRRLFIQEANAVGTTLPDSIVDLVMGQFVDQFGGAEHADTVLSKLGFTRADVRTSFRRDLLIRAYVQQSIAPTVAVSEADVRAYFDQNSAMFAARDSVRARHIILRIDEGATDEQKADRRAFMERIRQRAVKGEEFARLAQKYSEDGTAVRGGDLGYFARGTMVPEFEDAAFALKKGQMSKVVETRFGVHLILCVDKKQAGPASYDASKAVIEASLRQRALGTEIQNRLKKNRENAIITRNYDTGA
jgi:parvulin-like peptidyl-prolyl isomerase